MKTPLTFQAAGPVFGFVPGVEAGDIASHLAARQAQLEALLLMTYGETGDGFRTMSDDMQEAYMWACSMMAREIRDLTDALEEHRAAERGRS
ncbi:MAG: hypothetical protein PHI64_22750 [Zoogloea sp.]|uniref:hypothetical protein n=1 Tax=Zoogloea sp. TaxID=49181 RepID=UPI00260C6529|nr:hypothetical protein [Zoogloea sp.]MDD2991761.1 hypothetical protein [Zoogloea sp.]